MGSSFGDMFLRIVLSSCAVCGAVPWTAPGAGAPTVDVSLGASAGAHPEVSAFIAHAEEAGEAKSAAAMRADVAAFNSELRSAKVRIATAAERLVAAMRSKGHLGLSAGFLNVHRAAQASPGTTVEVDVAPPAGQVHFASVSGVLGELERQIASSEDDLFNAWPADFRSLTDLVVHGLESGSFAVAAPFAEEAGFGSDAGKSQSGQGYPTVASMLEGMAYRRGTAEELAVANHLRLQSSLLVRENALVREALRAALATDA